jgi:hypothetical protein
MVLMTARSICRKVTDHVKGGMETTEPDLIEDGKAWLGRADLHTKTEWLALLKADEALECAQQFNRGDCHLDPIRKMIAGRMRTLQTNRFKK